MIAHGETFKVYFTLGFIAAGRLKSNPLMSLSSLAGLYMLINFDKNELYRFRYSRRLCAVYTL